MPTSVGPKTYGKDDLVFGFDTGDTANSYRGEPTENLVDAFPDTSLPSGFYWTYEYSASISDSPIGNHFLSDKKWVKLVKTSATNGRVLFNQNSFTSGSTYTITAYAFINDSRNTALAFNSDNGGYSQETVDVPYNFTHIGTVQRIRGTWNQLQNGGSIYGLRGGSTNATGSTIYLTGLQVEENGHPTQLTQGIRSANSGSLVDLTGNSTIDLTNVSFDSNAQVDYDGSNDYINLGSSLNNIGSNATFEMVFKAEETNDNYRVMLGWGNGNSNYSGIHIGSWTSGYTDESFHVSFNSGALILYVRKGHTFYKDNTYHHAIVTAGPGNYAIWIDGVEQTLTYGGGNQSTTFDNIIGYNANIVAEIGRRPYGGGTGYFKGKLPLMKIYDRILTASEIKVNYNALKGRFNI